MHDFLLRAALAGVGIAVVAGPLGCFVVWRRLAYFGETVAHAALLGIALSLLVGVLPLAGILAIAIAVGALMALMGRQKRLAGDTLLGILSHGSLALGLVGLAFLPTVRVDLAAYLFGDILSVSWLDLWVIYGAGAGVLIALAALWRPLVAATVHGELAAVDGVRVETLRFGLILMLALLIAVSIKVVGILLVTAMLIIPPATARRFARTPEQMAAGAAVVGVVAVLGGLVGSYLLDTPSGPSIVTAALALFLLTQLPGFRTRPTT